MIKRRLRRNNINILYCSIYGESADLALRCKLEGNKVRLWIKEEPYKSEVYEGMIDKVDNWQLSVAWADVIVLDSNPLDFIWKQVVGKKPVFGGSEFAEMLEHDREYAHSVMKKLKINSPESKTFNKIEEVFEHLKEHKVAHVVKPFGKDVQSEHIMIGLYKDNSDLIGLLERFQEENIGFEGIEVEEKIEGIEVGYSCFFSGGDWCYPINVNFQHKPFAAGNYGNGLGFLTGETGTVMKYLEDNENKYFLDTLDKIKPLLIKNNYRGQIDLGLIVDYEGKPYALEYTPRNGTPSQYIEYALQKMDISQVYYQAAKDMKFWNKVSLDWGIGVVVMTPGFPSAKEVKKRSVNTPIFGVGKDNSADIHFYEVKKKDRKYSTTNGIGYPLVATNTADDLNTCIQGVYNILDINRGVYVPNSWYRPDIGQRVRDQMPMINSMGII